MFSQVWACVKYVPKQFDHSKAKKIWTIFWTKVAKPSRHAWLENLMIFSSQICAEKTRKCMSLLRTPRVYEILHVPMNPSTDSAPKEKGGPWAPKKNIFSFFILWKVTLGPSRCYIKKFRMVKRMCLKCILGWVLGWFIFCCFWVTWP